MIGTGYFLAVTKRLLIVLACLPVIGCGTVIRPASYPQMPKYFHVSGAKAALVLSSDLRSYAHTGSPSSLTGALQTYEFHLGDVIARALEEGFSSAFTNATVLPRQPVDASAYDLVIEPKVAAFDFAIGDDGGVAKSFLFGALGAAATGYSSNVAIRLQADVSDGRRAPLGTFFGDGLGTKPAGAFTWKASDFNESASAAVSAAVAKLVGEVSNAHRKKQLKNSN